MIQNFNLSKKKQSVIPCLSFIGTAPFTLRTLNGLVKWDGTLEYSTNKKNWSTWDGTEISSENNALYLRGTGNTVISQSSTIGRFVFTTSGDIECIGNIECLLDYTSVANGIHPTMGSDCFSGLFMSCPIITAPSLPSISLSRQCYYEMFRNTRLVSPPELPAMDVPYRAYYMMFAYCSYLEKIPKIPATSFGQMACYYMFGKCGRIKVGTVQTEEYVNEYRIPFSGTGTATSDSLQAFFTGTGGTFTGDPSINTTYYTSNEIVPAS